MVVILFAALIASALWLSTSFDRKKYKLYTVYMTEPVSGLSDESLVKFNGVRVGTIDNVELTPYDPQKVKIIIRVEDDTPITISTTATLVTQGITGTTYLGLSASSSTLLPLQKLPGETYPVIPTKPSFLSELEQTLRKVGNNINEVSEGIKRAFDLKNTRNLQKALANIQELSKVLAENSKNINQTLRGMPIVIQELKAGVKQFRAMSTNLAEAGAQVKKTMASGTLAIDKISEQTIPPFVNLMRRLDTIAANLEKVSNQMRQNPAVIIRGTRAPQSGPGE